MVTQTSKLTISLPNNLIAFADELASAAELVMGEADEGIAVVVIRGYPFDLAQVSARVLIRDPERDIFRR